jgi:glycosyltransferase involved in cell wall biosynthesis
VRILALPRDPNPYQRLLYAEAAARGAEVRYVGDLTPSRTLNLLALPLELAVWRARGWRVLHVHWVFGFQLPGAGRLPAVRRLAQAWFVAMLAVARALRLKIVWTAHNTLPHERVFHDDVAARRALVRASDLVVLHSPQTLTALEAIGAVPRCSAVVPPGPFAPGAGRARPPGGARERRFVFFGKVLAYKGVEELLAVAAQVPIRLTVAGECPDPALRARLEALATERVDLRLERLPDDELASLLAGADVVVLPFRSVTTSASALHAMACGRAVVLPDLRAFAELPGDAIVRYDGSPRDLARVLSELAVAPAARLEELGARAGAWTGEMSWARSAERMLEALEAA